MGTRLLLASITAAKRVGAEEGILVRDELEHCEGTGDSVWQRRGRRGQE